MLLGRYSATDSPPPPPGRGRRRCGSGQKPPEIPAAAKPRCPTASLDPQAGCGGKRSGTGRHPADPVAAGVCTTPESTGREGISSALVSLEQQSIP